MAQISKAPMGYDDTPMLPNSRWRVHDGNRPQPRVVTPGTCSTQDKVGEPPSDAIVLFDGKDASKWESVKGGPIKWKVENGYMEVTPTGNIQTKEHFGDCQLHIEWAAPAKVEGESQGRGNSGVFLMGKYEIQVLDGYNNRTYADGQAAAIYGQYPPLVNACRKPGEWQTYDIFFVAPRFEGDRLVSPAYITVVHNGVLVHHHQEILGPTGHKILPSYDAPHPPKGPLMLQDHRNPVRYRNIWIRPLKGYDE
ncbi:MAG: 3-keto-disaccharide hydrolase [bacterium]